MDTREHMLMVSVMTKQMQLIKILLDILKAHGLLEGDDAQAFEFARAHDLESNASIFQDALREYLRYSKRLGIETGLEALVNS